MKQNAKKNTRRAIAWYQQRLFVFALLAGVPLLIYLRTLGFGFTMLDDSIFIRENMEYNRELSNIAVSFQRGLFNPTGDFYYRPVFLVDFILESRLFGTSPTGYHFTNLLFHIICVILLYVFLVQLKIPPGASLFLALVFAVHPVLSQAVAWIPGRNDMLLMIFFLTGMLLSMSFAETPRWYLLVGQFLAFLLALFTKETAVIIPVIILAVLIADRGPWAAGRGPREKGEGGEENGELKIENGKLKTKKNEKNHSFTHSLSHSFFSPSPVTNPFTRHASRVTIYGLLLLSWTMALVIWLLIRSGATLKPQDFTLTDLLMNGINRSPALLQYLGKIFFPFNLTVFPSIDHITIWWGVGALVMLLALVIGSKSYPRPISWIGLGWYILFLVPVLVVPASLNDQVFEHRLYLPIVGILIALGQVIMGLNSKFKVQNSKFKIQSQQSTAHGPRPTANGPQSTVHGPQSTAHGPQSTAHGPQSTVHGPRSTVHGLWFQSSWAGMGAAVVILLLFSVLTYARIGYFKDPVTFWTEAVDGNPTSSYAHMMLGLRQTDPALMKRQFEEAYRLNPDEKMLNYLIGKLALDDNDIPRAEMHLKRELTRSDIPDNYFNLARVYFLKQDLDSAAWCLGNVIRLDPVHPQANHNLLLIYLQSGKNEQAKEQAARMRALGLEIPREAGSP